MKESTNETPFYLDIVDRGYDQVDRIIIVIDKERNEQPQPKGPSYENHPANKNSCICCMYLLHARTDPYKGSGWYIIQGNIFIRIFGFEYRYRIVNERELITTGKKIMVRTRAEKKFNEKFPPPSTY